MQLALCARRRLRLAQVDVHDSGGDDEALRVLEEQRRMGEGIATEGVRNPERAVAELLDALGELDHAPRLILELSDYDTIPRAAAWLAERLGSGWVFGVPLLGVTALAVAGYLAQARVKPRSLGLTTEASAPRAICSASDASAIRAIRSSAASN